MVSRAATPGSGRGGDGEGRGGGAARTHGQDEGTRERKETTPGFLDGPSFSFFFLFFYYPGCYRVHKKFEAVQIERAKHF